MTDYGRDLQFGYFLEPTAADPAALLTAARSADRLGLDLLGIQDHPYNSTHLDTWTLLSAIGATTERIRIFPDVTSLPLRDPAILAKTAASLDQITGGRVELGLGGGAFWDGIVAMGGPRRSPGEAVAAVEEAIDVLTVFWAGGPARYDGAFYRLAGARPGPPSAHPIGIWLGALGPKMLDLVGRKATGWLPSLSFVPPERLDEANERIDAGAHVAGREPAGINRVYNVWGDFEVSRWVDLLTDTTINHGMNAYVFGAPPMESELRRIAEEIVPAVRASVIAARS
ncbi:MAG: LLM class flavin-dependent oxidoreductase [Desertimonas sp.]